ncbi:MAG TPA: glutathione S-transferase family protein [Dongiaceae bacterium]|jgi:glutathione S-transferase
MTFKLYYHPLSSYCQKAVIALYENGAPFEREMVNLGDPESRAAFLKIWPIGKFPVLRDEARGKTVPESTTIIEYLDQRYPGKARLIPENAEAAGETRFWDRFFDLHVHHHMQKIVGDRLRPSDSKDPYGVEQAKAALATAYGILDRDLGGREWANGSGFSMADCSAAPPLTFANMLVPFTAHANLHSYFDRLRARPSVARAWKEAEPYLALMPK